MASGNKRLVVELGGPWAEEEGGRVEGEGGVQNKMAKSCVIVKDGRAPVMVVRVARSTAIVGRALH